MIVIVAALAGAILGALTAYRREGSGLDIAQYAAGFAVAFGILALIATVAGSAA